MLPQQKWMVPMCDLFLDMDVSKNRGILPPKMDGLFHGKPYEQMDDLGVPLFLETPVYMCSLVKWDN